MTPAGELHVANGNLHCVVHFHNEPAILRATLTRKIKAATLRRRENGRPQGMLPWPRLSTARAARRYLNPGPLIPPSPP